MREPNASHHTDKQDVHTSNGGVRSQVGGGAANKYEPCAVCFSSQGGSGTFGTESASLFSLNIVSEHRGDGAWEQINKRFY